jgi:hypothetical protein
MPLENLEGPDVFIDDLNNAWPLGSDTPAEGDDHLRGIKNVLRNWAGSYGGASLVPVLDGKAPVVHTHEVADITDWPASFPPSAHTHPISEVTDLQAALDEKAPLADPDFEGSASVDGELLATQAYVVETANLPSVLVNDGSHTLQLADIGRTIRVVAATNDRTVTIPTNASVPFPVGTRVNVANWYSTGFAVSLAPAGGVSFYTKGDARTLAAPGAGATLEKVGTDEWWAVGDLS